MLGNGELAGLEYDSEKDSQEADGKVKNGRKSPYLRRKKNKSPVTLPKINGRIRARVVKPLEKRDSPQRPIEKHQSPPRRSINTSPQKVRNISPHKDQESKYIYKDFNTNLTHVKNNVRDLPGIN